MYTNTSIFGTIKQRHVVALEEFRLSMTMLITLKPVIEDYNDYNFFSYYGQVVMDI